MLNLCSFLLFSQKGDMNLGLLGPMSWCWSCQTLAQYMTPQRSVQSPPWSPKHCPPRPSPHCLYSILPHWENLPLPSPLTSASTPTRTTEGRSSSAPCSGTLLRYLGLLVWPPSERDRGWSQRSKVKPSPSQVLQIVLHRLRPWGFGAEPQRVPFVSGDIFNSNTHILSWLTQYNQ